MRDEHTALDQVNALSKQESALNHVDFLAQQETMFNQMEERLKANLVESINDFAQAYEDNETNTPPLKEDETTTTDFTAALSTITGNSNKQNEKFNKLFDALIKRIDTLEKKCPVANDEDKENINPRTNKPYRRYCWSCGCCNHWGRNCPNRKRGHQINATFKNRMGGSTQGVLGA